MKSLISVILLNYNSYKHTIECIDSIKKSTYENYEIIIVDNNSTDESVLYLEKSCTENIYLVKNNTNLGFAAGNNVGIKLALKHNARFVLLLNNDTIVDDNTLNKLVNSYESCENKLNIGIVTCLILNYYDKRVIWYAGGKINENKADAVGTKLGKYYNENDEKIDKYVTFASGCCMLIPTYIFMECGLLPENYFLYYEDMEFCIKLCKENKKILFTNKTRIYHKESVSTRKNSPDYVYYYCRNRMQFIKNNIKGAHKILAYLYTFLWIIKKILRDHYTVKDSADGIKDYFKGKMGRRNQTLNES